jgi:hypothetical protein
LRKNTLLEHKSMASATPIHPVDNVAAAAGNLLRQWLGQTLQTDAAQWLDAEIERQRGAVDERRLGLALGSVGRRIGRAELSVPAADLAATEAVHRRWRPDTWSTDQAARVALVLATWTGEELSFAARVDRLCATGELTEHVACLKGFAVFPAPERLLNRAREAVRSSVQPLFEAIACQNPYPADHFDEAAYNQMIVKCVFLGVPIGTTVGLDERRNDDLVRMLRNLVSERNAAGRTVPESVHRYINGAEKKNR